MDAWQAWAISAPSGQFKSRRTTIYWTITLLILVKSCCWLIISRLYCTILSHTLWVTNELDNEGRRINYPWIKNPLGIRIVYLNKNEYLKELLVFWRNETFEWRHLVVIFENSKILHGIGQLSSRFTFAWSYFANVASFRWRCIRIAYNDRFLW